jgi:hypothetical protein
MAVHNVRYRIEPPTACPLELVGRFGNPKSTCEVDTDFVARCAIGEILQTGPNSGPMSALFDELLTPGSAELVWKGRGPGRGIEMRRAFSGLFGRFFARAYLQRYHGFTWFVPIDGTPTYLSKNVRVRRKTRASSELPDWVCAKPGEVAVAEAKGSHQKGNATKGGRPGPIKTAEGQISGVVLEKAQQAGRIKQWTARKIKGWAVMSRWGVEDPKRDAFQYVLDPETDGERLSADDRKEVVQDVARVHVAQTLEGMGYTDLAAEFGIAGIAEPALPRQTATIEIEGEHPSIYLAAAVGPFGLLPMTLEEARQSAETMPEALAQQIRFVGIDIDVVRQLRDKSVVESRLTRGMSDGTSIGPDDLLFAPIARIVPKAIVI